MYCDKCGNKLEPKFLEFEGMIPYCNSCNEYKFLKYSTAVSMVILNYERTKTLLIRQYGSKTYILVAGYVDKGESLEHALLREMGEEIGRRPIFYKYQKSQYFKKSETLICNFYCILNSEDLFPNHEIDDYLWAPLDEAKELLKDTTLAKDFFKIYLESGE